ncbi:MAG: hypothetical protein IT349_21095, partial [Candidatus Eisenbacteria bacterium]|nr:hypothetical protein [Candidatus Eisenbacteria bacterium]
MARGIRSIGSRQVAGEWVGGRIEVPFRIEGEPDRPPIMTLWLEPETGMVVQFELSGAGEAPSAFGDSLVAAMRAPLIGPPRQPRTVRVCGAELADEVRRVLPGARVVDAPTPELQQVV